nr:uncharacterized protein I206_07655 [Kwoniella pini CBS 10737]OCF46421.1 hypothetical protein I206_07655 [Kwoniella pini CBS 10737]
MEIPSEYHILQESKWFAYCNVHFLILYDDGIKWLLRIRQNRGHRLPSEITTPVIQSEVATLNFLKRHGIPVPGAHLPLHLINDEVHTNTTGLDYFFYEFIEGTPLDLPTTGYFGEISLPEEKLRLFVDEYARINIQLSNLKLPFKQLGCIYPSADRFGEVVGPIVTRGCFMNPKPPHFMGPFHTHKELLLAKIDAALRYSKVNGLQGEDTLDEYLWHLELRELVEASQKLGKIPTELFIKHDDKKGDELMVDENGHMLGIIDWEWAYVTTKEDAFSTPAIFNRTFDFFKNGSNELTYAEKLLIDAYERQGKADLADCVRSSRLYVRLDRIGLYDSAYKKSGFREVFGDDIPKDFSPPGDDIGWRGYMIKRYEHDQNLKEVIQKYGT